MPAPRRRRLLTAAAVPLVLAPLALAAPAAASGTANEVVHTFDSDGDSVHGVALRRLGTDRVTVVLREDRVNGWVYDDPELSPDGTKVVVSTDRDSTAGDFEGLAVVNRDGSGFTRLTRPGSDVQATPSVVRLDAFPAWSPDGSRVLFTRLTFSDPDGPGPAAPTESTALFTVPAGGGTPTALPGGAGGSLGDWSPDGRKVVFTQGADPDTGVGPLVTMDVTGAGTRPLGATGALPSWSPDGTTIAYTELTGRDTDRARRADITQIALVPATGGTRRILTKTRPTSARSGAAFPSWAPDSGSLVFDLFAYDTAGSRGPRELWAVDRSDVRAARVAATPAGEELQGHVQGPALSGVVAGTASRYVPIDPRRLLDTRPAPHNVGVAPGKVTAGGTRTLQVRGTAVTIRGTAARVPSDATAVVLNVTAVNATGTSNIRVYPSPATVVPGASSLNATPGLAVPNLVTARIGSDGAVVLRNNAGSVDLLADIAGYYVPATASGANGFAPLSPSRVLDTRPAPDNVGAPEGRLGPGGVLDLQVTGEVPTRNGGTVAVPADATAVVLNVTATAATASTNLRVYPRPGSGTAVPRVSNLNLRPGLTAANLATVAVGDGGRVRFRNAFGEVHVVADIAGYYSGAARGQFVPVAPTRFLDTREGTGAAPIPTTAGAHVDLRLGGSRGVPADALAAVLNLTGTGVSVATNVRAYPTDAAVVPTVSNLNLGVGVTRANLAIVKPGADGAVRIRNERGQLDLVGDLAGYFRTPPA